MSDISSLPSYTELGDAFSSAKLNFHPAQVHGLLCGYICATSGKGKDQWQTLLPGSEKNPACKELIAELYEASYHQLSEFSFEFTLLLPDDSTDINNRTEALGLWCQGFLTGLEKSHVSIHRQDESELTDALNDIMEIGQVNYGDISDNDDDETAYFELTEYVRLAILMIFQELRKDEPQKAAKKKDHLH